MSGDQFPPGSEEGPENADFSSSEQQPDESGEPAQIGASAPGAWPLNPDDDDVDLPDGGQYPDDMFGAALSDEAPIALPEDAFAGGLADVEYGGAMDSPAPLPPPPEPQELTEFSIDPLPLSDQADAPPPTGDDMFSVDELIGEPAEAPPAGSDMFSVDELIGEPVEIDQDSTVPSPVAGRPAPLAMPESEPELGDVSAQPASAEPLPMPEPSATPEDLTLPAPLATPEPFPTPESPASPEAAVTPQSLPLPEPLESDEPPAIAETPAAPESFASQESLSESRPPADLPEPVDGFVLPDPIPNAEPVAAAEAAAPDEPQMPASYDVAESHAETPASDFGFAGDDAGNMESAAAPESANPTMEPLAIDSQIDQPMEPVPDEPAEETTANVVNPYAQVADEAEVVDPAMSVGAGFELPVTEIAEGETMEIVNPYAQVSDEAEVVDPAMSLSASAPTEPEAAPEVFSRTDTEYAAEPVVDGPVADDPHAATPDSGFEENFALPAAYGEMSYAEVSSAPLPATDRTTSVAPPGMENFTVGGLVVAGTKGKSKSKSKNVSGRRGGKKPSIGKGRKSKKAPEAPQPPPVAEQPQPEPPMPMPQQDEAVAVMADIPAAPAAPLPDPITADATYVPVPAEPAGTTIDPTAAIPTPASVAFPGPAVPLAAQPFAPTAKAKQGKSLADMLIGKVEPGQRHKLFGIPIGKPTPLPGDPRDAAQTPPVGAELPSVELPSVELPSVELPSAKAAKRGRAPKPPKAGKAPKAAKQPKPAKAKQGKSLADMLIGKVEPGQRHKLFGIPIGKPTPLPGDPRDAAQTLPAAAVASVAPDVNQQFAPAPPEAAAPVELQPEVFTETVADAPPAPTIDAPGYPPAPPAQSPVASLTPPPPAAELSAPTAAPVGAEVIESLEAAAHKLGKTKRRRKQKPPKPAIQPMSAQAKQGKSLADTLLGKVEPGQRRKLFGIPIGKPTPTTGETRDSAQVPPAESIAEPAPPAWQPPVEQDATPTPAWQQPVEQPIEMQSAVEPPLIAQARPDGGQEIAPPPVDATPAEPPAAYPPAGQPRYVEPPVRQQPAASAIGENPAFSPPGNAATTFPAPSQTAWPVMPEPPTEYDPLATTAFPASPSGYAATAVLDPPVPAPQAMAPTPDATFGSGAVVAPLEQIVPPAAIPMQAHSPNLVAAAPAEAPVFKLARWTSRAVAQAIDIVLAAGILLLIGRFLNFGPLAEGGVMQGSFDLAGVALAVVVLAVYQGGMLAYGGQTLGKRVTKIRVVREDGKPIDLGYAMLREGAAKVLVSAVTAGVYGIADALWPAFDKQSRALHDIIVKSRVVEQ